MTIAFVLGNGVSRQQVELAKLKGIGKIYGCNALYRDFVPDVLVSTDRPISEKIQSIGYASQHVFYTRRPIDSLGARSVPQRYFGYSSGPIATGLACLDGAETVYLLGFDMGPVNDKFNNVYADTEFYKKSTANPTYTGNWSRQIASIMKEFVNIRFIRVLGDTSAQIKDFTYVPNYRTVSMAEFLDRINNAKDL